MNPARTMQILEDAMKHEAESILMFFDSSGKNFDQLEKMISNLRRLKDEHSLEWETLFARDQEADE